MTMHAARQPAPDGDDARCVERDIEDEFAFHLQAIRAELIAAGTPPDEAVSLAAARFGDIDRWREDCRRIAEGNRLMTTRRITLVLAGLAIALTVTMVLALLASRRMTLEMRDRAEVARAEAEMARARADALNQTLVGLLAAPGPTDSSPDLTVRATLDRADARLDAIDDPEVAARLREVIERARAELGPSPDPPAHEEGPTGGSVGP